MNLLSEATFYIFCKQTKNDKVERVAVGVIVFQQVDISFWNRTLRFFTNHLLHLFQKLMPNQVTG